MRRSSAAVATLPAAQKTAAIAAYDTSIHYIYVGAFVISVLSVLCVLPMRDINVNKMDEEAKKRRDEEAAAAEAD